VNLRPILNFLLGIALIFIGFIVGFIFFTNNGYLTGYKLLMVQSGSMEPTIMTGDVILIKKSSEYLVSDIITFEDVQSRIVTHRIFSLSENSKNEFITKGDANRTEDNAIVVVSDILGKVVYTIPSLGYLIVFAKKPIGIVVLLIIPSILIVFDEVFGIFFRKGNHG